MGALACRANYYNALLRAFMEGLFSIIDPFVYRFVSSNNRSWAKNRRVE